MSTLRDVANLQDDFKKLIKQNRLSKKNMCDLVIPFRDKYGLTDVEALMIARNELSISNIADILKE